MRAATPASTSGSNGSASRGSRRAANSSIATVPQMPHDEEAGPSRGVGAGATPPVSTVTSLYSASAAEPWPQ